MVYDPIKKKEYDRIRNAKLKAEFLSKNPNYKSSRKSKYFNENETTSLLGNGLFTGFNGYTSQNPEFKFYESSKINTKKYVNDLEADTKDKKINTKKFLDDDDDMNDMDDENENFLFHRKTKPKQVYIRNRKVAIKYV